MKGWLLSGAAVIAALVALSALSDERWLAGAPGTAAFAEVLRLVLYWGWCRIAWRVDFDVSPASRLLLRAALAAGLVTVALT
ncbi:MAG: hypothetical protein JO292_04765 [Betaproteobacteria bacterium]|nr:hypothetical protein [Betaproteobacteria bacterium]MBV9360682.1 hypothetical protein [Betaproteobacteria bacterium]